MNPSSPSTRASLIYGHAKDRARLVFAATFAGLCLTFSTTFLLGQGWLKWIPDLDQRLSAPGAAWLMALIVLIPLVSRLTKKPGLKTIHARLGHLHHYIPLWWVALTAVLIWTLIVFQVPGMAFFLGFPPWVRFLPYGFRWWLTPFAAAGLGHALFLVYWGLHSKGVSQAKTDSVEESYEDAAFLEVAGGRNLASDPDEFLAWVRTEEPVYSMANDKLGTSLLALRMAKNLRSPQFSTHAVVGPLGSGKTTVGRFLSEALERTGSGRRVRLIPIELWPFLTSDAAIAGILNGILDALDGEISARHLRMLPRQYLDLLASMPGFWRGLALPLQGSASDPTRLLAVMDDLAVMLEVKLVVWIDDLERFAGSRTGDGPERVQETERLSTIRALLHALGRQHSMTVVIATTSLTAGFDWEKIARFIHEIPVIPPGQTERILNRFRQECLRGFVTPNEAHVMAAEGLEDVWIDPTPPALHHAFQEAVVRGSYLEHREGIEKQGGFLITPQAMALLCRTPRALKQALRRVENLWQPGTLKGEMQFDQLLALCLLRDGCPLGFGTVRDHWARLQDPDRNGEQRFFMAGKTLENLLTSAAGSAKDQPLLPWDLRLESSIAALDSRSDRQAVRFLASLWNSGLDRVTQRAVAEIASFLLSDPVAIGPQGLRFSPGRADAYWRQFIDEIPIPFQLRDQVLIKRALRATATDLADLMANEAIGPALVEFAPSLPVTWQGVLLELARSHSAGDWGPVAWLSSYMWPRAMVEILRQFHYAKRMDWNFEAEFEAAMVLALTQNLELATLMEWVFLDPDRPINWFPYQDMASRIRAHFRLIYASRPGELVGRLNSTNPLALKQLCFGLDAHNQPKNPEGTDLPEWIPPLFLALLREMEDQEETRNKLLPQMAQVIVVAKGNAYVFQKELAFQLFGGTDALFEVVRKTPGPASGQDALTSVLQRAALPSLNLGQPENETPERSINGGGEQ